MKKTVFLVAMAAACYSCQQSTPPTVTEAVAASTSTTTGATFGATFAEENTISVGQLADAVAGKDSVQATVAAEVQESCQAKGCWMDVRLADGNSMKVTFRDYGFFLPVEDLKGRQVVFTGTAKREVISVEDQRHYAQDAGKPEAEIAAITAPKEELRFVADGVILK